MKDFIEAINIFLKYVKGDWPSPFSCEHDVLRIFGGPDPIIMDKEDIKRLDELGFFWDEEYDCWKSLRFGSC